MGLKEIYEKLKSVSGSHSPSIETISEYIGHNPVKIDACFLSNPYATDLFFTYFKKLLETKSDFRKQIEFYPPVNRIISKRISRVIDVPAENIIVGNGAIEVIQMIMHNHLKGKICLPIPTFSPYYEYAKKDLDIHFFKLDKKNNFEIVLEELVSFIRINSINNLILINPNNPTGNYINKPLLINLLENLQDLDNIILDESFIDFSYDQGIIGRSVQKHIATYSNLTVVKSMSKDFGIAGLRCGYGVMSKEKVNQLLNNGYLWNVSGLSSYFFQIFEQKKFQQSYFLAKKKYLEETTMFFEKLQNLNCEKFMFYPSKANFILLEIMNNSSSVQVMLDLVEQYGIYVRECSDKIGLDGQFLRIASRSRKENKVIYKSLLDYFSKF